MSVDQQAADAEIGFDAGDVVVAGAVTVGAAVLLGMGLAGYLAYRLVRAGARAVF